MSTPRKAYWLGPCELLRLPWPREIKMAFLMLQGLMVDRWRGDNLDRLDAERIVLDRAGLWTATGRAQLAPARRILGELSERVKSARGEFGELSIEIQGELTAIFWSNLADFQQLPSGRRVKGGPDEPPPKSESASASASASASSSDSPEERSKDSLSPPPAAPPPAAASSEQGTGHLPGMAPPARKSGRRRKGERLPETPPPLEASPELIAQLEEYTKEHVPSDVGLAAYHVRQCLNYARSKGWMRADWPATFRTWIEKAPEMRDFGPPPKLPPPRDPVARVQQQRSVAEQLRIEEEERSERERRRNAEIARHKR